MSSISKTTLLFSRLILPRRATTALLSSSNRTYKSNISLDKLYPQSSLSISRIPEPPQNEPSKFSGFIPIDKLEITCCKSSGPGGMNVNKLNTKANIRFKVDDADWIPADIFLKFKNKFRNQIAKDGYLSVQSDRTRHQHLNVADAMQKIREMVRSCEEVKKEPSPEDAERHRRLIEKAARERLLVKRKRSDLKSSRGAV